jgi:two-component system chemotaxis response regulator CheB
MLCDDSATMRRLIKTALKSKPEIQVVCEAENGQVALDLIDSTELDLIVMDVEMPVMDGIDATREIRKRNKSLPIIMFSSLTSRGAEATLDALAAGANDFVAKPAAAGHISKALENVQQNLIPMICQLVTKPSAVKAQPAKRPFNSTKSVQPTAAPSSPALSKAKSSKVKGIAIGVSTGGPVALVKLLSAIPVSLPVPIVITQHMPPVFTKLLADRLTSQTKHQVKEATEGEEVAPGNILLAPGDFHMTLERSGTQVVVRLSQDEHVNSCRPAVDPLFASFAKCFGPAGLGIVLTGMGKDGVEGARKIKQVGGRVFAQDQDSSVVWGMPSAVIKAGLADQVLPLAEVASAITDAVQDLN